jgi:hypothetical protein
MHYQIGSMTSKIRLIFNIGNDFSHAKITVRLSKFHACLPMVSIRVHE